MLWCYLRNLIGYLLLIVILSVSVDSVLYAGDRHITLDLQNASLPEAIRVIAGLMNLNVVISDSVSGVATLHLREAEARPAFEMLLTSHNLASWRVGNVWYVAPRAELVARKKDEVKWQELSEISSPLMTAVWQVKYANAADIVSILQDDHAAFLSKRGQVRVDARTNVICVRDIASRLSEIGKIVRRLDVPVKQIRIDARLASVDSDHERELGIDFNVKSETAKPHSAPLPGLPVSEPGRYSVAVARLADGSLLDVKLAALEDDGHAELISSPSLFTANQQTASIEAGEEVPYQEVSESGGTAVAFKKAVLGLKVAPQVLPGNRVLLRLQINQDRPGVRMVQGMPTIRTRQIVTSVLVKSGQTVVLGGIYETTEDNSQRRIPFISDVPLIGRLFQLGTMRTSKRELLIFVTPNMMAQDK